MAKYLLDRCADPNVYTTKLSPHRNLEAFLSPLEQAFLWFCGRPWNLEIIAALINAGTDANPTPDYSGDTPILSFFERAAMNQAGPEVV